MMMDDEADLFDQELAAMRGGGGFAPRPRKIYRDLDRPDDEQPDAAARAKPSVRVRLGARQADDQNENGDGVGGGVAVGKGDLRSRLGPRKNTDREHDSQEPPEDSEGKWRKNRITEDRLGSRDDRNDDRRKGSDRDRGRDRDGGRDRDRDDRRGDRRRGGDRSRDDERGSGRSQGQHDDRFYKAEGAYDEVHTRREEERKMWDERRRSRHTEDRADGRGRRQDGRDGRSDRLRDRVSGGKQKGLTVADLRDRARERRRGEERSHRDRARDSRRNMDGEEGGDNLPPLDDRVSVLMRLGQAPPQQDDGSMPVALKGRAGGRTLKFTPQGIEVEDDGDPNLFSEPRREATEGSPLQSDALYMYGTDGWSVDDVMQYWESAVPPPLAVEPINDSSCIVTWSDARDAQRCLQQHSKPILLSDYPDLLGINADDYSGLPELHWRQGRPFNGRDFVLLRGATVDDVKWARVAKDDFQPPLPPMPVNQGPVVLGRPGREVEEDVDDLLAAAVAAAKAKRAEDMAMADAAPAPIPAPAPVPVQAPAPAVTAVETHEVAMEDDDLEPMDEDF